MAHFFSFAIIRLCSSTSRDERLNIGIAIFQDDSVDVRLARRIEKVRSISGTIDNDDLKKAVSNFLLLDKFSRDNGINELSDRYAALERIGPFTLSNLGTFQAENMTLYEDRINTMLKDLVDPEPAIRTLRDKKSKLLTEVKRAFAIERVLAKKDETIDDHRIVAKYEIEQGLVADLILKNGAYHIVETVDIQGDSDSAKRILGEIGISTLVIESARIKFGEQQTKGRIIYNSSTINERLAKSALIAAEHQGCELVNWASAQDKMKIISDLSQLATPRSVGDRRKRKSDAALPRLIN